MGAMVVDTALELVELTPIELRTGAHLGIDRYVRNLAARRPDRYGASADDWAAHVLGAWGELAVAKYAGLYWFGGPDRPDRGAPDVAGYHVRTRSLPTYELTLHDEDDDEGPFVLVVPHGLPRFRIVGWCYGHEGKRPDYWQTFTGRPCYFVPHAALRPLRVLLEARP